MPLRPIPPGPTSVDPVPVVLSETLVRKHQAGVWRYLRFLGAQPSVADDLTQETFLALLRGAPDDRGDAATAGWLRTVARRLFSKHGQMRRGLEFLEDSELEAAWLGGEGAHDLSSQTGDDYSVALDSCLQSLTPRARRALELRYRDDSSRDDMARELDISTEGVKSTLRRTRDTLLACIQNKLRSC